MIATTPGSFKAFDTSILLMSACGTGLRRSFANSILGRTMSSANRVCPVHFARASTLRKGFPTTLFGLPFVPLFIAIDYLFCRLGLFATHARGGQFYRLIYFNVAGTAAKVPRQRFF